MTAGSFLHQAQCMWLQMLFFHTVKVAEAKFKYVLQYKVGTQYCQASLQNLLLKNTIFKIAWIFSLIGWDSQVSLILAGIANPLVDDKKDLCHGGDELKNIFVDYSVREHFT